MRYIVEQLQLLCKKPPKGFEKYFEAGGKSGKPKTTAEGDKKTSSKQPSSSSNSSGSSSKSKPPTMKPSTSSDPKSDWNFGMFSNSSRGPAARGPGTPSGRPLGEGGGGERERWILFGAIGAVVLIASFAFFEMGYKEISWKEFVNRCES